MMVRRLLFHQFGLIYRISFWFSRHFSPLGHFLLGLAMVSAAFGANTRAAATYQLSALLVAVFCISLLWSYFGRRAKLPLSVERQLPRYATVGEPLPYQITLSNHGTRVERGLSMLDQLSLNFPTWAEFSATADAAQERRNPFDRYVGFHRWQGLMRTKRGSSLEERPLPDVPPGQRVNVTLELNPLRRGRLQFSDLCIYRPDPFGLFRTRHLLPLPKVCHVLPRHYPISPLPMVGGRSYQRGGVALANAIGESHEFLALRDFRLGDVPRNIHWRSSAKLGRWVVKEFQDEYFVRQALILDTFADASSATAFEAAVSVTASLVIKEPQRDSLLDLLFIEQDIQCFTAGRGLAGSMELLEVLAGLQPASLGTFDHLAQSLMQRTQALSEVVLVLLDWDPPRQNLVQSLRLTGLPLAVLLVREQLPDPPPEPGCFFRLVRPKQLAADLQWN